MQKLCRSPQFVLYASFIGLLAVTGICSTCHAQAAAPNIVLMYVDNVGYGDLGCYGNIGIRTPRIDELARQGARCTDFYIASSTCTVSRGTLLTGRHALRNGLVHQLKTVENWHGVGLPHRERILPQYLQAASYKTACFGKWNIGFAPGSRPTERGFEHFFGCRSGNINYFTHMYHGQYDMYLGTEEHRVEGYSTDLFADATCEYISQQKNQAQPFFVYVPFNAPHYVSSINMADGEPAEWQVPAKYLEQYGWSADEANEKRRYFAVMTALDDAVGRVLDTLDSAGLSENTLVMFISDMGAILRPTHGYNAASNFPFRDGAPSMYEGSIRVPAIFRWPGKIPAGIEPQAMLSNLDILPLCLAAAGQPLPSDRIIDGRNPLPALNGEPSPHPYLVSYLRDTAALRAGDWKIVQPKSDAAWELYDLKTNPIESNNLAASQPARVSQLVGLYDTWLADVQRDASPPVPYTEVP
jgi:arylsulfatase A